MSLRNGAGKLAGPGSGSRRCCAPARASDLPAGRSPRRRTGRGDARRICVPGWRSRQPISVSARDIEGELAGSLRFAWRSSFGASGRFDLRLFSHFDPVVRRLAQIFRPLPAKSRLSSISSASSLPAALPSGPWLAAACARSAAWARDAFGPAPHLGAPRLGLLVLPAREPVSAPLSPRYGSGSLMPSSLMMNSRIWLECAMPRDFST